MWRQCYETLATSESEDEGALASVRRWFSGPKRPPLCAHTRRTHLRQVCLLLVGVAGTASPAVGAHSAAGWSEVRVSLQRFHPPMRAVQYAHGLSVGRAHGGCGFAGLCQA